MSSSNKNFIGILGVVLLIILIPLIFSVIKSEKENEYEMDINITNNKEDETDVESELYVEQIWFKNIEMLDDIPIDQSLLIQDEITYYFQDEGKCVEEVELQEGTLNDFGNSKLEFKATYNDGIIIVKVDKDKVTIQE